MGVMSLIDLVARQHKINPHALQALGLAESDWNPHYIEYVPNPPLYFPREAAEHLGCSYLTEVQAQSFKWGVGALPGFLARELGYRGWLTHLSQLELGLDLAAQFYAEMKDKYGDDPETCYAAYHGQGSIVKTVGGQFTNMAAVDHYMRIYRELTQLKL